MKLTYKTIHMLTIEFPMTLETDTNDTDFHKRIAGAKANLIILGYTPVAIGQLNENTYEVTGHKVTRP